MSEAEIKVLIRYAQIIFSLVLLAVVAYLGLSWASHQIGICMTVNPQTECVGPFYHARHAVGIIVMSVVLFLLLSWPVAMLLDRWKKDVEKTEAKVQEEKKRKQIEEFERRA